MKIKVTNKFSTDAPKLPFTVTELGGRSIYQIIKPARFNSVSYRINQFRPTTTATDSTTKLCIAAIGEWHLNRSSQGYAVANFGLATDKPVPADYDGDGKTDAAIYRNGQWWLLQSTAGVEVQHFGLAGDKPVQSAFLP